MKTSFLKLLFFLIALAPNAYSQTAKEYFDSGWAKSNRKEYIEAIADYSKSIVINPNSAIAHINRALAKIKIQDFKGAIIDCNKAIEINPSHSMAYNNKGLARIYLQDYKSAIIDCNKAIELNPNFAEAYINKGWAKMLLRDFKGAIIDCSKAIELNANFAEAYQNRGLAKIELGERESGCLDLKKAAELGYSDPNGAINKYCINLLEPIKSNNLREESIHDISDSNVKSIQVETPTNYLKTLHFNLTKKNPEFTVSLEQFERDMLDENNLKRLHTSLTKRDKQFTISYEQFKKKMFTEEIQKTNNLTNQLRSNQISRADTLYVHFQTDKIKVGDTFIDLPIPSGFVKVDDTMSILLDTATKMCPETNTLLAYYISEEDYAKFLVNQDHLPEKYIFVEVFNVFKNIPISSKDYRQFINSFKNKYLEEFKQILDEASLKTSENISNLYENLKMGNFKMQPFGICYESKNSISYGILSKYNFTVENESSKEYIVAAISTITKVENKPIFLFAYKIYNRNEDINSLKALNSAWIKEVDRKQSPVSFIAGIDFEDYKEAIFAILTLSFIWAIYFATKKIQRKLKTKNGEAKIEIEDKVELYDFDELLIEEKTSIDAEPIPVMPKKTKEIVQIKKFNLELFKVNRQLRLFHFFIDMAFIYFVGICTGYVLTFLIGQASVLEHQYLIGLIVVFFTYFIQEYIFGKTIGKFITKTHVVNSSGNKPTIGQLILRNFIRIIPFEAFTFVLKDSRGFHDSISNTYVIKD
ncbi:MAG: hypothetical protein C0397_03280 [Odoribacter sp.]|nr:hypothetical protein [Odoribacter sp.]